MYRRYYSRLLFSFACLSMVGVNEAWSVRTAYGSASETGGGDVIRQLVYMSIAILAIGPYLLRGSPRALKNVPASMFVLLVWCAITMLWSPVPDIAARRLALTALVVYASFMIVRQCSPHQALRTLWHATLVLLALSLVTAVFAPLLGIHQPGDPDSNIVGNWRGIFYHKNKLGVVAAVSLLLSLHFFSDALTLLERRAVGLCILLSGFLLVESGSKTSLGMALICALLQLVLRIFAHHSRRLIIASVVAALVLAPVVVVASGIDLLGMIDSDSFTGRGLIWQMALGMMKDSASLTGIGFQSVFQVGDASIFAGANRSLAFLATVSHAHNSYLELFISIGAIGCALASYAILVAPIRRVLQLRRAPAQLVPVCFSILLFIYLHSLLESELLNRDSIAWILFLLVYAIICSVTEQVDERGRVYRSLRYPQGLV